jgi:hypothetical protein
LRPRPTLQRRVITTIAADKMANEGRAESRRGSCRSPQKRGDALLSTIFVR